MGKKLESNFKNMVLVLFGVTLIASTGVAYVNSLTAEPIAKAKQAKQANAIREVIPGGFDNDPMSEAWKQETPDGGTLEFFPAKRNGQPVGTAVKTYTKKGFGGEVWLMVGFNPDGTIANYSVLEHKETPGLGSKMDRWFGKDGKGNVTGKHPGDAGLKVSKDGGDVDAITAATISSRAFLDAINRAAGALAQSHTPERALPQATADTLFSGTDAAGSNEAE